PRDPYQLPLWVGELIMQSADDAERGAAVIVLDELAWEICAGDLASIEGFDEVASLVAMNLRREHQHAGQGSFRYVHREPPSAAIPRRYSAYELLPIDSASV